LLWRQVIGDRLIDSRSRPPGRAHRGVPVGAMLRAADHIGNKGDLMARAMMRMVFVAAGLLLAACSRNGTEEPAAPAAGSTVFEVMNASIIPQSTRIWELSGELYNDDGDIDSALLTDPQWKELQEAANAMGAGAKSLTGAGSMKVAPAGAKIQSEGTEGAAGAADVQAAMDANPQGFKEHATQLVAIADEIAAAAAAHDGMKTDDAGARLTDVCGACHAKFWYPQQAAP
jgi:cytochrome c556